MEYDSTDFASKYQEIFYLAEKYYQENNIAMSTSDLATVLNQPDQKKHLKIFVKGMDNKTARRLSFDSRKKIIQEFVDDYQIESPRKIQKDMKRIKEQNRYAKFKNEMENLLTFELKSGKLGEEGHTIEDIQRQIIAYADTEDDQTETDMKKQARKRVERLRKGIDALPTGYNMLDKKLNGGFAEGRLGIIAARPSIGKTQLTVNMVYNAFMKEKKNPLLVFLEGRVENIWQRFVVLHSQRSKDLDPLTNDDVGNLGIKRLDNKGEIQKYYEAVDSLAKTGLRNYMFDMSGTSLVGSRGLQKVRTRIERELIKNNDIDAVYIDHMHHLKAERNQNLFYGRVAQNFHDIATSHNIPVIALAQLNRNLKNRRNKRPTLTDLRGSGEIEQTIDYAIALHRDDYQSSRMTDEEKIEVDTGTLELIILKNKNGSKGMLEFNYQKDIGIIDEEFSVEKSEEILEKNPDLASQMKKRYKTEKKQQVEEKKKIEEKAQEEIEFDNDLEDAEDLFEGFEI
jgi:replicative DNA helicase